MKTTNEQKEVVGNTMDAVGRMSEIAFSSIERLTRLNLDMASDSLRQGIAVSVAMTSSHNGKDQDKVQNPFSGAGAERITDYVKGIQEVLSDAQSEFARLLTKHMSSFSMNGWMSFPGMEVFEKIVQQTSDMTKANIRNASEATESLVATSASQRRKSA